MKLVLLFTGGRSGSDLLQSLFDSHKSVANFQNSTFFRRFFKYLRNFMI